MNASERGYHPWAFSEVLLHEAWKLLDYHLVVELARRCQTWLHRHFGVTDFYFVKDTLLSLNKHWRIAGEQEQTMRRRIRRNSKRGQRRQTKHYIVGLLQKASNLPRNRRDSASTGRPRSS